VSSAASLSKFLCYFGSLITKGLDPQVMPPKGGKNSRRKKKINRRKKKGKKIK
jgi:hypothetical protein